MAELLDDLLGRKLERYKGAAKQGSDEWKKNRCKRIGGSEASALLGQNPYTTEKDLMARKLGLETFSGNTACHWGTMFEEITERLVEMHLNTRVRGTDAHIDMAERFPHLAYSPDGFCVARVKYEDDAWSIVFSDEDKTGAEIIALLEFKAPYGRIPNHRMTKYYEPQVFMGLMAAPWAQLGIFVDVVYRLCTVDDLNTSKNYSKQYHVADVKKEQKKNGQSLWEFAHHWGLTAVYAPKVGTRRALSEGNHPEGYRFWPDDNVDVFAHKLRSSGLDLAKQDYKVINRVLGFINSKQLIHQHGHIYSEGDSESLQDEMEFMEDCPPHENFYLLGYLPWKVFDIFYHIRHREPGFAERITEAASSFMEIADGLRQSEDVAAAYRKWRYGDVVKKKTEFTSEEELLFSMVS